MLAAGLRPLEPGRADIDAVYIDFPLPEGLALLEEELLLVNRWAILVRRDTPQSVRWLKGAARIAVPGENDNNPSWVEWATRGILREPMAARIGDLCAILWNVNSLRNTIRNGDFGRLLDDRKPDVVCLTEVKANLRMMDRSCVGGMSFRETVTSRGYTHVAWASADKAEDAGRAGVAILSRVRPVYMRSGLGDQTLDVEGRYAEMEFDNVILIVHYTPCSGVDMGARPKREKYNVLINARLHDAALRGKRVLWTGDFNTVRAATDAFDWRETAEEREQEQSMTSWERHDLETKCTTYGFVDILDRQAALEPDKHFTWWRVPRLRRKRKGRRIDYVLWNGEHGRVVGRTLQEVKGSDHCPIEFSIPGEGSSAGSQPGPPVVLPEEALALAVATIQAAQRGPRGLLHLTARINGVEVRGLIDSGSAVTIMSSACGSRCGLARDKGDKAGLPKLRAANGSALLAATRHRVNMLVDGKLHPVTILLVDRCTHEFIVGSDFLSHTGAAVDFQDHTILIDGRVTALDTERQGAVAAITDGKDWTAMPLKDIRLDGPIVGVGEAEEQALRKLIEEYEDVFAVDNDFPGLASSGSPVRIPIAVGAEPVYDRPRQTNPKTGKIIKETVGKYLVAGIIEPSNSPWSSCPVVLKKKNGSSRISPR